MAKKIAVNLDLLGNEIKNFVVDVASSAPTAKKGALYYDTSVNALKYYNGTSWITLATGGDATAIAEDVTALTLRVATNEAAIAALKKLNIFSKIKVGSTEVVADTDSDTVEFSGSNITIIPDATNDKITFSLPTASTNLLGGIKVGSRLSISEGVLSADVQSDTNFTQAEKTKLAGIASGANAYVLPAATDSTLGGVKVDKAISTSSTNPVQNKVVTSYINSLSSSVSSSIAGLRGFSKVSSSVGEISASSNASTLNISASGATKLSISSGTLIISSSDTDTHWTGKNVIANSTGSQDNSSATNGSVRLNYVENSTVRSTHLIKGAGATSVTADTSGNITVSSSNTDTHWTSSLVTAGSPNATSNAVVSSNGVYLNHIENSQFRSSHKIQGSGSVSVKSDADGTITINGTDTNTTYTLSYDSSKFEIYLKDNNGNTISTIDATSFVKDGMLIDADLLTAEVTTSSLTSTVEYNGTSYTVNYGAVEKGHKYLLLAWNVQKANSSNYVGMAIDVQSLVDTYTAGAGLKLTSVTGSKEFSIDPSNLNFSGTDIKVKSGSGTTVESAITVLQTSASTQSGSINTINNWISELSLDERVEIPVASASTKTFREADDGRRIDPKTIRTYFSYGNSTLEQEIVTDISVAEDTDESMNTTVSWNGLSELDSAGTVVIYFNYLN